MTGRIGIVGTSYWAEKVHGVAAREHDDWDLVSIWGRSSDKAARVAEALGCAATTDFSAFLDSIDTVVFAVPPDVQAPLALQAVNAGKHVLLEKPLALDPVAADVLVAAITTAGVANVVFFTRLWAPASQTWLHDLLATGGWESGRFEYVASLPTGFLDGSPWRAQYGGLWDVGPHALSVLETVLGRVTAVAGIQGSRDLVQLSLRHGSVATSTTTLTLTATPDAAQVSVEFWGASGRSQPLGGDGFSPVAAAASALSRLATQAHTGSRDSFSNAEYGAHVVHVLAAAQAAIRDGRTVQV